MKINSIRSHRYEILLACLILLSMVFSIWGIPLVPFHPDESTYLFMSQDFEYLFMNPASLTWSADKENDLRQIYRELDAPLTRYLLGLGRLITGKEALPADWDWSLTWEENQHTGALPTPELLTTGRLTITLLLPISLLLIYLVGRAIGKQATGFLAALLLGLNALILLHDRRSMAEGALTLGVILALWSFLVGDRHPWLAGLCAAIAFNAKHSALALLPVGLISVLWLTETRQLRLGRIVSIVVQFLGVFALVTILLNPLYWRYPIPALRASLDRRQELLSRQVSMTRQLAPEQVLESPGKRCLVLLANLYLAPLQFAEVGNYVEQTQAAELAYLNTPGHNLLRNLVAGGVFLALSLIGIILACTRLRAAMPAQRRSLVLILLTTGFLAVMYIIAIPLPWQRYVIPLIPMLSVWTAYAIESPFLRAGKNS